MYKAWGSTSHWSSELIFMFLESVEEGNGKTHRAKLNSNFQLFPPPNVYALPIHYSGFILRNSNKMPVMHQDLFHFIIHLFVNRNKSAARNELWDRNSTCQLLFLADRGRTLQRQWLLVISQSEAKRLGYPMSSAAQEFP